MSAKPARNASAKRSRTKRPKRPKRDKATVEGRLGLREQAIAFFHQGLPVGEIANRLSLGHSTVYSYIAAARSELLRTKKEYFDERLAFWLDDSLDTIAAQQVLLRDREFLLTADPARIGAINNSLGILSDKCLLLLAAAGGRSKREPEQPALTAGPATAGGAPAPG